MNQKKPKAARNVVLDRTGEGDKDRYSGLKMSQIVDDEEMGNKLAEYNKKMKDGTALKPFGWGLDLVRLIIPEKLFVRYQ